MRGKGARVTLYDPLTGADVPVRVLRADAGQLTVDVPLTDSPRLLTLQEAARPLP